MVDLEQKIKDAAQQEGIELIGLAGLERLSGPPSLDPSYTMRGARSIVSFALPMDVNGIYDWLSKKTHVTHQVDQTVMNPLMREKAEAIAEFIRSLGYRARAVATNNNYRRSPDVFKTYPVFSHRFGAIAAGIGAQGWSGNVMTKPYGAAVYLGTVVTDARLKSDPVIPPRYFIDNYCYPCRLCEKTCVAGMFDSQQEEYVLLNNELHPRAKRHNIDFCNASCFGLHSISRDKKWSTWGIHWIGKWIDGKPEPHETKTIRRHLLAKGSNTGDSTPRYKFIRNIGFLRWPQQLIQEFKESYPSLKTQAERNRFFAAWSRKLGVKNLKDDRILTCGNCALVCGPTLQETRKRYEMLINSGIVIPGPDQENVVVKTYQDAVSLRHSYMPQVSKQEKISDARDSAALWSRLYLGFEPVSALKAYLYRKKLARKVEEMGGARKIATPQPPPEN